AFGYLICFWMSLTVIRPFRLYSRSTTSSFSTLCRWRISLACSTVVPPGTVMRSSLVMSSETARWVRVSKRRSRLVRMPTRRGPTVTGTPLMRYFAMTSSASETRAVGATGAARGGRHRPRVGDPARLGALALVRLGGLRLDRHVLVDEAEPALLGHGD